MFLLVFLVRSLKNYGASCEIILCEACYFTFGLKGYHQFITRLTQTHIHFHTYNFVLHVYKI